MYGRRRKNLNENELYLKWKEATGTERETALLGLIKELTSHAKKVCWERIPDFGQEIEWISNDAVYQAVSHLDTFEEKSAFSTWFHRIVLNACNLFLRRIQEQRLEAPLEDAKEMEIKSNPVSNLLLKELVAELTGEERMLLELLRDGYTRREAAEFLKVSPSAIQRQWTKLATRLKDAI